MSRWPRPPGDSATMTGTRGRLAARMPGPDPGRSLRGRKQWRPTRPNRRMGLYEVEALWAHNPRARRMQARADDDVGPRPHRRWRGAGARLAAGTRHAAREAARTARDRAGDGRGGD